MIAEISAPDPDWLNLRRALWPECPEHEHRSEMQDFARDPSRFGQFIAYAETGSPIGLAEVAVRVDHVNGTKSSPVAFLEALYVVPTHRKTGVARRLVAAVEAWAQARGLRELASDTELHNLPSQATHCALGFAETERVIYYRKRLPERRTNTPGARRA
jgi:aminoglycoside 6'-N-acetyltransferase I